MYRRLKLLCNLRVCLFGLFMLSGSIWAGFDQEVNVFRAQMLRDSAIVNNFLEQVALLYQLTHTEFPGLGDADAESPRAISNQLPASSAIANLQAQVIPHPEHDYANLVVYVDFKSRLQLPSISPLVESTRIVFIAYGQLGTTLRLPLQRENPEPIMIENRIISYRCSRQESPNTGKRFAFFSQGSENIDFASSLAYPFNICEDIV